MDARIFAVPALVAALALGACDTDATRPLLLTSDGGGGLLLHVTPAEGSVTPTYSWSGGAGRILQVSRAGDGALVWRIEAIDGTRGFLDPVQHGVVPAGARQTFDPVLLEADTRYRVSVVNLRGQRGDFTFLP